MRILRVLQPAICVTLAAQLVGCGTLLHPERRGQKSGRLDPAILILDGIGLLLFIIPGLVAFAIDFTTGAIYLPPGMAGSVDQQDLKVVRFDPRHATAATIEEILWKETGQRVTLTQETVQVSRLDSLEDIRQRFAAMLPAKHAQLALNTK